MENKKGRGCYKGGISVIEVKAYAKINLFLEVLGKREDGYHNIESIFQSVSLADNIFIRRGKEKRIILESDMELGPIEKNSAYKAANFFLNYYKIDDGMEIKIEKRIPIAGGLGGSSADAAGVINGLSKLYDIKLDNKFLSAVSKVGADVPFMINGGIAKVTGIGEKIERLPYKVDWHLVIGYPGVEINSGWAYKSLKFLLTKQKYHCNILVRYLSEGDFEGATAQLFNRFEEVVLPKYPAVAKLKNDFLANGAKAALMSGSGSSVFAVFSSADIAMEAVERMQSRWRWLRYVATAF